jgi:hypothetical protein
VPKRIILAITTRGVVQHFNWLNK